VNDVVTGIPTARSPDEYEANFNRSRSTNAHNVCACSSTDVTGIELAFVQQRIHGPASSDGLA